MADPIAAIAGHFPDLPPGPKSEPRLRIEYRQPHRGSGPTEGYVGRGVRLAYGAAGLGGLAPWEMSSAEEG